jgi:hypothetical protein
LLAAFALLAAARPAQAATCSDAAVLRAALPDTDDHTGLVHGGGAGALARAAGKLWLYDGCRLHTLPMPPATAVPTTSWVFSPTDVWMGVARQSGDHGSNLLRFDGHSWREVPGLESVPGSPVLWASGPADLWIGSRNSAELELFRWDGRRVARVEISPHPNSLPAGEGIRHAVAAIGGSGPSDVWVAPTASSFVLHGDGKRWTKVIPELPFAALSFWAPRPGEAWATGTAEKGGPNVFRWDGTRWHAAGTIPETGVSIAGSGRRLFVATPTAHLFGIDAARPDAWSPAFAFRDGWAYLDGLHLASESRGYGFAVRNRTLTVLRWDGHGWTAAGKLPDEIVSGLVVSATTLWALTTVTSSGGGRPASRLLRRDGDRFVRVGESALPLVQMTPGSNDGIWAVGAGGSALRCAASGCAAVGTGIDDTLIGAWPSAAGIRAVGASGTIIESDGGPFRTVSPPRGWDLKSAWGRDRDCVWAVGPDILKLGARGWNTPGDLELLGSIASMKATSIAGATCDDVWVVAARDDREGGAFVARWNGKQWGAFGPGTASHQASRLVSDGNNLWLVGAHGLLWRLEAPGWLPKQSGTKETIWSAASDGGDIWIAAGESPLPIQLPPPLP